MRKPVFTTLQADLQILEIDAWWRENRDKAPELFEEELELAFIMLADSPGQTVIVHPSDSITEGVEVECKGGFGPGTALFSPPGSWHTLHGCVR